MVDNRIVVSRPDGRPEAYRLTKAVRAAMTGKWECALCKMEGKQVIHPAREMVMTNPVDSADGQPHMVCVGHLPDDIVIFDPDTNQCSNKDGTAVWVEGTKQ